MLNFSLQEQLFQHTILSNAFMQWLELNMVCVLWVQFIVLAQMNHFFLYIFNDKCKYTKIIVPPQKKHEKKLCSIHFLSVINSEKSEKY